MSGRSDPSMQQSQSGSSVWSSWSSWPSWRSCGAAAGSETTTRRQRWAVESVPASTRLPSLPSVEDPAPLGRKPLGGGPRSQARRRVWPEDFAAPAKAATCRAKRAGADLRRDRPAASPELRRHGGSCSLIEQLGAELAAAPPDLSSELRSYETLLQNVFHLFRVAGRERLGVRAAGPRRGGSGRAGGAGALSLGRQSHERCSRPGRGVAEPFVALRLFGIPVQQLWVARPIYEDGLRVSRRWPASIGLRGAGRHDSRGPQPGGPGSTPGDPTLPPTRRGVEIRVRGTLSGSNSTRSPRAGTNAAPELQRSTAMRTASSNSCSVIRPAISSRTAAGLFAAVVQGSVGPQVGLNRIHARSPGLDRTSDPARAVLRRLRLPLR